MFRKPASNPEPRPTIFSELRSEFGGHLSGIAAKLRRFLMRRPKLCFALMITSMLASGILAFTVMRSRPVKTSPILTKAGGPFDGLGQLMRQADALKNMWRMKNRIDTIMAGGKLNPADSLEVSRIRAQMDSLRLALRSASHSPLKPRQP